MYRNSSRFNVALILGALVWVMILLSGCVAKTPIPTPTSTPVPIATWVAQGVPEDTDINYSWEDGRHRGILSVDIRSDGTFTCESRVWGDRFAQEGRLSPDGLERIVLKFAEVDFFALSTCGHGCIYYVTHPIHFPIARPCVAVDFHIEQISIYIRGMHHGLWIGRGICDIPGDSRADQGLNQLVTLIRSVCDRIPSVIPTMLPTTAAPAR